jgi:hypothetical protein
VPSLPATSPIFVSFLRRDSAQKSPQKIGRRITQLLAPEQRLAWLMEIERELFSQMRPRSKWDRVVLAEVIIEAGLTLIAEAELAVNLPNLTRARMVRNGLMLALLAQCPIRLKNFAALQIGRSPKSMTPGGFY